MTSNLLGSLEQKIMDILWQAKKPLKPAEVLDQLGNKHAYTTIMTELKRMSDKKLLSRKLSGRVYLYFPVTCKDVYAKNCLGGLFGNLVGSFGDLAISQFVSTIKKNPRDLKALQKYLASTHD